MVIAQIFQPQASIRPTTSDRRKRTTTGKEFFHLFANVQATIVFGFNKDKSIFRMTNMKRYLMRGQANFVAVSNL
jgi:hypothetical protein